MNIDNITYDTISTGVFAAHLVAALGVHIDGGQEAGLSGMSVNPAQGVQTAAVLSFKNLLLIQSLRQATSQKPDCRYLLIFFLLMYVAVRIHHLLLFLLLLPPFPFVCCSTYFSGSVWGTISRQSCMTYSEK